MKLTIYYKGIDSTEIACNHEFKMIQLTGYSDFRVLYLFRNNNMLPANVIVINKILKVVRDGVETVFKPETVEDDFMIFWNNLCVESNLETL